MLSSITINDHVDANALVQPGGEADAMFPKGRRGASRNAQGSSARNGAESPNVDEDGSFQFIS